MLKSPLFTVFAFLTLLCLGAIVAMQVIECQVMYIF